VVVFTHNNPGLLKNVLKNAARTKAVDKAESIQVLALDSAFLDALDVVTDRNAKWTLVHSEGILCVTSSTPVTPCTLID
jgi:hypothetical protein